MVFFVNEMRCLTNAVFQACLRSEVVALREVPPFVRGLVEANDIVLGTIARVTLHACPQEDHVEYTVEITTQTLRSWHDSFKRPLTETPVLHMTHVLYDRNRDGKVEHLHLVH